MTNEEEPGNKKIQGIRSKEIRNQVRGKERKLIRYSLISIDTTLGHQVRDMERRLVRYALVSFNITEGRGNKTRNIKK